MSALSTETSTLAVLKIPNYRTYLTGQLVTISGTWVQNLAQGFLVFQLTKSEAWLGVVACASGLAVILLSPISGVVVDRIQRKRILFITQCLHMLLSLAFFALTYAQMIQVWHIVVMAFISGAINSVDFPARQTFVLEMVGSQHLKSGIALNATINSASRVLGPAIAGVALVSVGVAWCFLINALTYLVFLWTLWAVDVPYPIISARNAKPIQQLREGLAFARHHRLLAPLLLTSLMGGVFVVPLLQFLSAFADVVLNSPKEGYALLSAAQGAGSVLAGMVVGTLATRYHYGKLMAFAIVGSGASSILLALQTTIPLAMVACFLGGLFMVLQFVSMNTLIQTVVPNEFRGRILALYTLSFSGFTPFGSLILGFIATAWGTPFALALFGVLGVMVCFSVLHVYGVNIADLG